MAKKKNSDHYIEVLRKLKNAGLQHSPEVNRPTGNWEDLPTLEERVDFIIGIIGKKKSFSEHTMLFFIMYDIESNKVRYNVAKYLEKMGCHRIQKSIFLADLSREKYDAIRNDLAEVQALYENNDSIIVCPVSSELLNSMKIIGRSIQIDVITHSKNTLFF